ncbi:hypothetical protein MnTg02_03082 [bacterium MnTg02]|nr:hypothetical protein MnTg02_03082 [bacterium MnTg02]
MPILIHCQRHRHFCGMIACVLLMLANTVAARAADEPWEIVLKQRLVDERQCHFDRWVQLRKIRLGEDHGIDGRLRCRDGRNFDITRHKAHQKFEIRSCLPAIC